MSPSIEKIENPSERNRAFASLRKIRSIYIKKLEDILKDLPEPNERQASILSGKLARNLSNELFRGLDVLRTFDGKYALISLISIPDERFECHEAITNKMELSQDESNVYNTFLKERFPYVAKGWRSSGHLAPFRSEIEDRDGVQGFTNLPIVIGIEDKTADTLLKIMGSSVILHGADNENLFANVIDSLEVIEEI